jgi:Tfp pilus assembly pilus retraction ATPase PilT
MEEVVSSDHFICRYYDTSESKSVQKVSVNSMLKRGMELSHYQQAYENYLSSEVQLLNDDFSIAIQRLQISVIPDQLPCREMERARIDNYLKEVIVSNKAKPPLYICGMPGTGKTATVLSCINSLRKEAENRQIPEFDFIEINCLRLKAPVDACKRKTPFW